MEVFIFLLTCLLLQEVAQCMLSKYSIYTAPHEHADSVNATVVDGFPLPWQKRKVVCFAFTFLIVSEISVQSHLVFSLWACGTLEHYLKNTRNSRTAHLMEAGK